MIEVFWKLFEDFVGWVDKVWLPPYPRDDEFGEADWSAGYFIR